MIADEDDGRKVDRHVRTWSKPLPVGRHSIWTSSSKASSDVKGYGYCSIATMLFHKENDQFQVPICVMWVG